MPAYTPPDVVPAPSPSPPTRRSPRSDQSQTVPPCARRRGEPESRHRLVIPGVFPDVFLIRGRVTIQIEPSLFRPHSRPRGRERDEREDHQRRRDDGDGAPATPRGSSARRVDVARRARGLRVIVGRREKLRAFLARHRARRRENPRGADCRDGRSGSRARFGVEARATRARLRMTTLDARRRG